MGEKVKRVVLGKGIVAASGEFVGIKKTPRSKVRHLVFANLMGRHVRFVAEVFENKKGKK